ncbi:unnamed protein product [Rotaria sp. Silwood1]|nr:unnamed protein product [Rotaria sp. Silwood1]CAF1054885.1 unnamed protein product [Rotaria sp. Silwood1]CAF4622658.1 unnamed protein product [Rotaria sp. Silwood1]CAF4624647.1 unnamed protein product [Rotaria sp. Silwood1]
MTIRFNILAGCESGIVKGIDTTNNGIYVIHKPAETYADAITLLEWSLANNETDYMQAFITTKKNNILRLKFADESIQQIGTIARSSPLRGLAYLDEDRFLTCSENGVLSIDRIKEESLVSEIEANAGPDICRLRINPFNRTYFGTGGKENDLKIWSIEELMKNEKTKNKSVIFQAKNIRPNAVRLRMPVWITDFQFIDERNRCLVVTGHHQIRLYDPQSNARRPVNEIEFEQYPIMSIALLHSSNNEHFIVGNTQGEMAQFDIKRLSSSAIVHKYKGVIGSIRSIDTHPTLPLIASASIDQYVRIHNADTYRQISKFYLKSRLTSVLFSPHSISNREEQQEKNVETINEEIENDEVWSQFKRKLTKESSDNQYACSSTFSHITSDGNITMVDIGHKASSQRRAIAEAIVKFPDSHTYQSYFNVTNKKGDARLCSKIAGILAAKRTSDLIPLCHPLPLSHIDIEYEHRHEENEVLIRCICSTHYQTGVEMEAMVGATIAAVTIYDMCKALSKSIEIRNIRLIEKIGGKSSITLQ